MRTLFPLTPHLHPALPCSAVPPLPPFLVQDCCQRLHKVQQLKATGPEQLLRARFAAYVKKGEKCVGKGGWAGEGAGAAVKGKACGICQ